jgi:hypothetical protein
MPIASTVNRFEKVVKFFGPIEGSSRRGNCPDTIMLAPKTITKVVCICCDIFTSFMMSGGGGPEGGGARKNKRGEGWQSIRPKEK